MAGEGNGNPLQYSYLEKIPWTEEPAGLQSMGSQSVGHDWAWASLLFWERDDHTAVKPCQKKRTPCFAFYRMITFWSCNMQGENCFLTSNPRLSAWSFLTLSICGHFIVLFDIFQNIKKEDRKFWKSNPSNCEFCRLLPKVWV